MTAPSGDDGANASVSGQYKGHPNTETYFRIVWKAPGFEGNAPGVTPIQVCQAVRLRLDYEQHVAPTEKNAKLLFGLIQAIEAYEGSQPTVGGELNNLIPKEQD